MGITKLTTNLAACTAMPQQTMIFLVVIIPENDDTEKMNTKQVIYLFNRTAALSSFIRIIIQIKKIIVL